MFTEGSGPELEFSSSAEELNRAKTRTLKMTVVICATFFLCWTPYNIMSLWFVFKNVHIYERFYLTLTCWRNWVSITFYWHIWDLGELRKSVVVRESEKKGESSQSSTLYFLDNLKKSKTLLKRWIGFFLVQHCTTQRAIYMRMVEIRTSVTRVNVHLFFVHCYQSSLICMAYSEILASQISVLVTPVSYTVHKFFFRVRFPRTRFLC
jgi:hypothetical protein